VLLFFINFTNRDAVSDDSFVETTNAVGPERISSGTEISNSEKTLEISGPVNPEVSELGKTLR